MRHLIINGDDLGMCEGVNRAIYDLHNEGIVTSASILIDGPVAQDAVYTIKRDYPGISLGLHLDFGDPPFSIDNLAKETRRQWNKFIQMIGDVPTHVNVHRFPDIAVQLFRFLPVRVPTRKVGSINYIDKFSGAKGEEGVSLANLIKILLRIKKGVYEISCQPGYEPMELEDGSGDSADLREQQLRTLLNKKVKQIIASRQISLISYNDLVERSEFYTYILERYYAHY